MNLPNHDLRQDIASILINETELQTRIWQLAAAIDQDYAQTNDLLLVCALKGAYVFLADLSRALQRPHHLDFMALSSYGGGTTSSGAVQILMDLTQDIKDRHILVVEDIIDSGRTLTYILRLLQARQPASVRICTLLSKPSQREVEVKTDYVGFEIPDEFVVGYGLDFDQSYRQLPFIAVLKPSIFLTEK